MPTETSEVSTAPKAVSPRSPELSLWLVVATVALALVASLTVAIVVARGGDSSAAVAGKLDIAVVGDSFAEQSADQIVEVADAYDQNAEVAAYGGASMCTFRDQLAEYLERRPKILVLSFAGNDLQPCFNPSCKQTDGDPELECDVRPSAAVAMLYRVELDKVLAQFRPIGAEVYVMLPPPVKHQPFEERAAAMRDMYRQAAQDIPDLHLIDPSTRLDPEGEGWVDKLPCEAWDDEDCGEDGEVVLRQSDGIHLTPAGGERYARALLDQLEL